MTNIEEIVTSSKRLYDGKIINLRLDTVRMPDGRMSQREIVEHRGAVAMVPMLDNETVILVRQYRRAAGQSLLEIPAGTRDPDEDIEAVRPARAGRRDQLCRRPHGQAVPLLCRAGLFHRSDPHVSRAGFDPD